MVKNKNKRIAKKAAKILNEEKKPRPTLHNKWIFTGMKYKAIYGKNMLPFEYNYWKEKGWLKKNYNQTLSLK